MRYVCLAVSNFQLSSAYINAFPIFLKKFH